MKCHARFIQFDSLIPIIKGFDNCKSSNFLCLKLKMLLHIWRWGTELKCHRVSIYLRYNYLLFHGFSPFLQKEAGKQFCDFLLFLDDIVFSTGGDVERYSWRKNFLLREALNCKGERNVSLEEWFSLDVNSHPKTCNQSNHIQKGFSKW